MINDDVDVPSSLRNMRPGMPALSKRYLATPKLVAKLINRRHLYLLQASVAPDSTRSAAFGIACPHRQQHFQKCTPPLL